MSETSLHNPNDRHHSQFPRKVLNNNKHGKICETLSLSNPPTIPGLYCVNSSLVNWTEGKPRLLLPAAAYHIWASHFLPLLVFLCRIITDIIISVAAFYYTRHYLKQKKKTKASKREGGRKVVVC